MTRHNVKWGVSLSNGETLYEGKGNLLEIEGELSPWQKLMGHLKDSQSSITSLFLYTDDGQRWNVPPISNHPKFQAFGLAEKPIDFNAFRRLGRDVFAGGGTDEDEGDLYTIAEAIFANYRLQIWVNERNPKVSWTLVL